MVKQINIGLDDDDHAKLIKAKGLKTWREFIMQLTGDPSSLKDGSNGSNSNEMQN